MNTNKRFLIFYRHDIRKRFEDKQKSEQESRNEHLSRMMAAKQFRAEQQAQKKQEEADLASRRQVHTLTNYLFKFRVLLTDFCRLQR